MKKIIFISLLFLSVVGLAQLPVSTKIKNLATLEAGKISTINAAYADTLKSGDTLFYKVLVNHSYVGYPYISLITRLVANDTTSTLTLWQSVDGTQNWQQITKVSQLTTLLFDTTAIYGRGGNNVSTMISDTTLVYGRGGNGQSDVLYDTTKIMNHVSPSLKALYSAKITEKNRQLYSSSGLTKNRSLYSATGTSYNTEAVWNITVAKASSGSCDVSFWRNNARFESQYLGIRFIAKTKSGFKAVYYGSVRYDNQ